MTRRVVASVPAAHPYVAHLSPPPSSPAPATDVVRLPDPDPACPERQAGEVWWPPVMLEPAWVATHDFDLMHVHFGLDERTPAELEALVAVLRERSRPLVLTLHDLRSPHQQDRSVLDAQLDVVVPAAAALLTLTAGAADEIERRWGRRAEVVPHPHLVDLPTMDRVRRLRAASPPPPVPRVGLSVKSLRPNCDPGRLLAPLLAVRGARLVVSVHRSWWEHPSGPGADRLAGLLAAASAADELELVVHEPFDDARLWAFVAGLDVAVLPYRFGTHSGWLEMCHDLGTSVVVPSLGHYRSQGAEGVYRADEDSVDEASVVAAVSGALDRRRTEGIAGAGAATRSAQRAEVAAVHDRVYAEVLAGLRPTAAAR